MDSFQIFPLSEIASRLSSADERTKNVRVYSGHITGNGARPVLAYQISRNPLTNDWPGDRVAYLDNLRGKFTVQFLPSRETFFVESEGNNITGQWGMPFFGDDLGMNGTPMNNESYQKIIELEKQVIALTAERDALKEKLLNFETNGGKMAFAMGKLMDDFLLPKIFKTPTTQTSRPMQGTKQNWQEIDIDEDPAKALEVLHLALQEELLLDTAYYLQDNPQMVQQLRLLIPKP